ncbi:MAG TPA: NAD(+)--rifampin ADP-ribosyltransferase [Tepidiformaceae bacterium]|nr:NAD(+)--rifampin ADP-ribosyltransferase [Tepidiformaceae bacterium]
MYDDDNHIPVTFEHCDHVEGPFYHGTKADLRAGDLLMPGYGSNFEDGRVSNNIYFSGTLDAAVWGAELARGEGAGRIYFVEPTGPFEDDPNLTNKRFRGNPTKSYRTREPLRVVGEVEAWEGHPPEVLQGMRDSLDELQRQGLATIED